MGDRQFVSNFQFCLFARDQRINDSSINGRGRRKVVNENKRETKVICKTSTRECGDIFRRSGKICIVSSPLGYHPYMIKIRKTLSHTQTKNKDKQEKSGQITIRIAFVDVTFRFSPNDFRALLKSANLSTQKGT